MLSQNNCSQVTAHPQAGQLCCFHWHLNLGLNLQGTEVLPRAPELSPFSVITQHFLDVLSILQDQVLCQWICISLSPPPLLHCWLLCLYLFLSPPLGKLCFQFSNWPWANQGKVFIWVWYLSTSIWLFSHHSWPKPESINQTKFSSSVIYPLPLLHRAEMKYE